MASNSIFFPLKLVIISILVFPVSIFAHCCKFWLCWADWTICVLFLSQLNIIYINISSQPKKHEYGYDMTQCVNFKNTRWLKQGSKNLGGSNQP